MKIEGGESTSKAFNQGYLTKVKGNKSAIKGNKNAIKVQKIELYIEDLVYLPDTVQQGENHLLEL